MSFPIHDWQFWVVTALALVAAAWLARGVIRFAVHVRRGRAAPKKTPLTIEGRTPDRSAKEAS